MSNSGKPVAPASHPSARWTLRGYLGEVWSLAWRGAVRPIHTIRTREPVSLFTALGVHLVGTLFILLCFMCLSAVDNPFCHCSFDYVYHKVIYVLTYLVPIMQNNLDQSISFLYPLIWFLAMPLFAVIAMPLTSSPEPLWRSWYLAWKRLLLASNHLALWIILFELLNNKCAQSYLEHSIDLPSALLCLKSIFLIWLMILIIKGIGARNWNSRFREHNVCLKCGYLLYGLPPDKSCPECGYANQISSSDSSSLPSSPSSGFFSFIRLPIDLIDFAPKIVRSIFTPRRFSQEYLLYSPEINRRLPILEGLVYAFLLGWLVRNLYYAYEVSQFHRVEIYTIIVGIPAKAIHIVFAQMIVMLAVTTLCGMICRLIYRRNLMTGLYALSWYQSLILSMGFLGMFVVQYGMYYILSEDNYIAFCDTCFYITYRYLFGINDVLLYFALVPFVLVYAVVQLRAASGMKRVIV